eukprot:3394021-Amphidinium_carterae.1
MRVVGARLASGISTLCGRSVLPALVPGVGTACAHYTRCSMVQLMPQRLHPFSISKKMVLVARGWVGTPVLMDPTQDPVEVPIEIDLEGEHAEEDFVGKMSRLSIY